VDDYFTQFTPVAAVAGVTKNFRADDDRPKCQHLGQEILLVAQFGKVHRVTPDLLQCRSAEGEIGGKYKWKPTGNTGKNKIYFLIESVEVVEPGWGAGKVYPAGYSNDPGTAQKRVFDQTKPVGGINSIRVR